MNKYNRNKMIKFELFYKIVSVAVLYPVLLTIMKLMLKLGDVPYLTNEYLYKFITKPTTIIGIIIVVFMVLLVTQLEQQFIYAGYERLHGERMRVAYILDNGFAGMKNAIKGVNLLSILLTGVIVLTMNLAVIINIIMNLVNIKVYIAEGLKKSIDIRYHMAGILVIMMFVTICGIFVSQIMYDKKTGFFRAFCESYGIAMKNIRKVAATIIGYNAALVVLMFLMYVLITAIVVLGVRILGINQLGAAIYLTVIRYFTVFLNIVLSLVCIPISFFWIIRLYEKCGNKLEGERIISRKQYHGRIKVVILVACVLDCFYIYSSMEENHFRQIDFFRTVEITSHRGSSSVLPENTMAAFEQAVEDFSDYIELDVRQTYDGKFVVMHDENLKRTTGVNMLVGELTQEQISEMDAAYGMEGAFEGMDVTVPTLEEVLAFTKGKMIRLNIELKTSKLDKDYATKFYELLVDYDMLDSCVITSSDYNVLKEMKQLDEDIKTGYILSVAAGNYYDMEDVDFFSVNYRFVTSTMIYILHSMNKEIHIWTLNDADNILKFAGMGADNIITDDPILAREVIYSKDTPDVFVTVLNYVFGN